MRTESSLEVVNNSLHLSYTGEASPPSLVNTSALIKYLRGTSSLGKSISPSAI